MSRTLTTRISERLEKEIEEMGKDERIGKSAEARRLLERAVRERKIEKALRKYEEGGISLGRAAEEADLSLRELLAEMKKRDVHFRYSRESLKEDIEAA